MADLRLGDVVIEGKTKIIQKLLDKKGCVLVKSKDRITCGDGARAHDMEGKAAISTATTCSMFQILNQAGIKTHFVSRNGDTSFIAKECHMIPIEWVTRRIATGSFLKRNVGVKEGFRFCPPKLETFYKDDANHDPQWSHEQLLEAKMNLGGTVIGPEEVAIMGTMTVAIFEILERAWASQDCSLVDMKIEFGVCAETGEILLADVVDNDSWRLWPSGDSRLMKDKQVYRNLKEVTPDAMKDLKKNFQWVANKAAALVAKSQGRVVVIMGSPSDIDHCKKIKSGCDDLRLDCHVRVCSAHKATEETLAILKSYEGDRFPTVFIAVAGRSNGLGPVMSGNSVYPVINCPPPSSFTTEDVWSSLRMPSGLGCSTVLAPTEAAINAAQILALHDYILWCRLRAKQVNTWVGLKNADKQIRKDLAE